MKAVDLILKTLLNERKAKYSGGLYEKTQVDLAYNSNYIEGSRLSKDHTRQLFETRSILAENEVIYSDDIICANNHFRAFNYIIDHCSESLDTMFIKKVHRILMSGTSMENMGYPVGEYKSMTNYIDDNETAPVDKIPEYMNLLLGKYNGKKQITFEDIVTFHSDFEHIHPFQDGNGRTGRILMFRECLRNKIIPFIISDENKMYYYNGLKNFEKNPTYLLETCGEAQDNYTFFSCQLVKGFQNQAEKEKLIRPELQKYISKRLGHGL